MPIHFEDTDFISEVKGLRSALIVPCRMCPAATIAVREKKPFMELFKSLFKSQPFEQYLNTIQALLTENGVKSKVFGCTFYHQWFMCMWSLGTRKKLLKEAKQYDAVLVLGCSSATVTVRDTVKSIDCKVIEGMEAKSIMNAKLSFQLPCNVFFKDCKETPLVQQNTEKQEILD
ncbi:hypothetical protein [Desulfosediminicola ganghwensis]|uniref:hypothetical protein n=1 Tax=Desulfosediminicola ganghwensis TaxID=2569540 RepID=UPI0010ACD25D|nr:hypothetical protein [Desulfosediminicola ganghwensis]